MDWTRLAHCAAALDAALLTPFFSFSLGWG